MLIFKTNPRHNIYVNFYLENDEICIEKLIEPSLTSQFYGAENTKSSYKICVSDNSYLTSIEYIAPMMILFKELFPKKNYNVDKWIEKCENYSSYYNYYETKCKTVRPNKIHCYQYVLRKNNINNHGKKLLNSKILKAKSVLSLKNTINQYKQYLELEKQFN